MKAKSLKPDIRKVFLVNLFKIFGAVILIIAILVVLHLSAGLGVFTEVLGVFGFEINPVEALVWLIIAVVALTMFVLFVNYLMLLNVKYEFYDDRMIIYKNVFLIFIRSREVPYTNISKVTFDSTGFLNGLFNTGTISLDLSTMGEENLELEFIDDVVESAKFIQDVIRAHLAKAQAEYTERHRIDGILDRGKYV